MGVIDEPKLRSSVWKLGETGRSGMVLLVSSCDIKLLMYFYMLIM